MSRQPISRSDDLRRLEVEGYSLDLAGGKLVVRDVPFVDSSGAVHSDGFLVMPLELAGEIAQPPTEHTASFGGGVPCTRTGADLTTVVNGRGQTDLGDGIIVECTLSMKPIEGGGKYPDFYEKVTKYVAAIAGHASAIDANAKAAVFRPIPDDNDDSPFKYINTASSRAGIDALNAKLRTERLAIIGLGGTGEYILDFTSKTEVETIHVFDGDIFLSHNAFRGPGAPTLEELNAAPLKVDHFVEIYSRMRDGIVPHRFNIDETNVAELRDMTFVFISIDDATAKKPIIDFLREAEIPFIDVGIGIELIDDRLTGGLRTTLVTPDKNDHAATRISVTDTTAPDDYKSRVQIAELNARNATDAIIAWKKYRAIYADLDSGYSSVYTLSTNYIVNSDRTSATDDGGNACG